MKKLLSSGESSTVCPLSYLLFRNLFILDWTKSSGKPFSKKITEEFKFAVQKMKIRANIEGSV